MDLKRIRAIVELVKETGLAELEITEGEEKLRISLFTQPQQVMLNQPIPQQQITTIIEPPQKNNPNVQENIIDVPTTPEVNKKYITSPMVGTFYSSPAPNKPAFVTVGQQIKAGQTLCIIEAMKLMNQIESDQDGTIKEILINDGMPVEFGEKLFIIE